MANEPPRADNETGKSYEMPIIHGPSGRRLVDVPQVLRRRRDVHLRPRLHLDRLVRLQDHLHRWRRGILLYRGYNIAELAEQSDFMECCYLLMKGELPE